jgi:hypothetical protein
LFELRLKIVDLLEKLLEKFLETGQGMVELRSHQPEASST